MENDVIDVINVQKDWDHVITKVDEKFWVMLKRVLGGHQTLHGYLRNPSNSSPTQSSSQNVFSIKDWKNKHLQVYCSLTDTTTSFIAPQLTLSLCDKQILSMDISPSGGLGVSSSVDGKLWIWDTDTGETRRVLEGHVGDVDTCRFFPSGIVVLSGGSDLRLKIWSAQTGGCARTLTGHTRGITDSCIIERGRNIISTSTDGTARLWDCGSGQCLSVLADLDSPINGCGIVSESSLTTPPQTEPVVHEHDTEGKVLFIVTEDGNLRTFDIRNRIKIAEYFYPSSPLMRGVAIDGMKLVIGAKDGGLRILDLRQLKDSLKTLSFGNSEITSLQHHSQCHCISGYRNGSCILWNCDDVTSTVTCLTGPDIDPVTSLVTTRNGWVYSGCRDGHVRIYTI